MSIGTESAATPDAESDGRMNGWMGVQKRSDHKEQVATVLLTPPPPPKISSTLWRSTGSMQSEILPQAGTIGRVTGRAWDLAYIDGTYRHSDHGQDGGHHSDQAQRR